MTNWVDFGITVGGLAAVGVPALGFVIRHVGRSLAHTTQQQIDQAAEKITTQVDARLDKNDEVTHEVRDEVLKIKATVFPNGGKSIADRVQRIEVSVAELRGELHGKEAKR